MLMEFGNLIRFSPLPISISALYIQTIGAPNRQIGIFFNDNFNSKSLIIYCWTKKISQQHFFVQWKYNGCNWFGFKKFIWTQSDREIFTFLKPIIFNRNIREDIFLNLKNTWQNIPQFIFQQSALFLVVIFVIEFDLIQNDLDFSLFVLLVLFWYWWDTTYWNRSKWFLILGIQ